MMVRSFKAREALQEVFQTEEDGERGEVRQPQARKILFSVYTASTPVTGEKTDMSKWLILVGRVGVEPTAR